MTNNFVAGLTSVSTAWTHQNPPARPSRDAEQPRVSPTDLYALIHDSNAALERIDGARPRTPAPTHVRQSRIYDPDSESIITPLTRSEVGSIRSNYSRWSSGTEVEPSEQHRSVLSTADLGEFPGELQLHTRSPVSNVREPAHNEQRLRRTQSTTSRISRFFLGFTGPDPALTQLSLPEDRSIEELLQVEQHADQLQKNQAEGKPTPKRWSKTKSIWASRHSSRNTNDPAPAYSDSIEGPYGEVQPPAAEDSPPDGPEDECAHITGFKLAVLMLALSLAVFLVSMDVNIIATALPSITEDFDSVQAVGWFGSAYLMTTCGFQILFGRIYTFFPTKWVFMSAIGVFEVGSLVAAAAPNASVFIAGRAIQGMGTSGIISGALIIISQVVPLHQRPRLGGVVGSMEGIAMICAPILGGFLTSNVSWRMCFYINLPVGGFVLAVVLFYLQTPPPPVEAAKSWREKLRELDLVGTALLIPAIVCLLLALEWGGTDYEWNDLGIVLLFILAGVLLSIFTYFQWVKQDLGTIPPRIIRKRSILAGAFFSLCTSAALVVMTYYLPLWFQAVKGASASKSGLMILPLLIGVILAVVLSGALVSALGHYTPFMIGGSVLMSVGAGLMSTFKVGSGAAARIVFPAVFGAGVGLGFQQPMIAAQTVLGPKDVPVGTSLMVFAQTFGGAVVLSVAQAVFNNRLAASLRAEGLEGVDVEALLDAGATAIAGLVPEGEMGRVLDGYNSAITQTFYVALTVATLSVVGALAMEWRSVRTGKVGGGEKV